MSQLSKVASELVIAGLEGIAEVPDGQAASISLLRGRCALERLPLRATFLHDLGLPWMVKVSRGAVWTPLAHPHRPKLSAVVFLSRCPKHRAVAIPGTGRPQHLSGLLPFIIGVANQPTRFPRILAHRRDVTRVPTCDGATSRDYAKIYGLIKVAS